MSKKRIGFIGRHIMMKRDFAELVLAGIKTATVRLGIVRPKKKHVLLHSGGKVLAELEITDVEVKKVRELSDEDAKQDGFESKEALIEALKKIYGDIKEDDDVTIVRFRVLRRIESSEMDENSRYLGLRPVDIASIALRYGIKLHPRDLIILKKVAETGSIRRAAVALFGDVTKRKAVRVALSKAVKKLIDLGIISKKDHEEDKARD
ncbi:MAG: ASCH domain-containing protein [Candidatus Nezhaarchaeales archaeon]